MTGSITVVQIYQHTSLSNCQNQKGVFTCHSCVKLKYPLAFPKLHDDIVKIIRSPVNLPSSPIKPTTPPAPASPTLLPSAPLIPISPLTPSAPLPPPSPFTPPARVRPGATQSPLAPLPPHTIQVPTNPLTLQPPPVANNKALNKQLATKAISSTSPKSCKFYMQGHCRYGKKAFGCSYPQPPMCFKFIKSGYKGCPKGDSCKLCTS